jgi:hypothetical protein
VLNIPIWSNPEDGSKHTDIWTGFLFRTAGLRDGFAGRTDNRGNVLKL